MRNADRKSSEAELAAAVPPRAIVLSDEVVLVYVLHHSGCVGRLTAGRVERDGLGPLNVYDRYGGVFEYLVDANLRSWCVFGPDGNPIDGWSKIVEEDVQRMAHPRTGQA